MKRKKKKDIIEETKVKDVHQIVIRTNECIYIWCQNVNRQIFERKRKRHSKSFRGNSEFLTKVSNSFFKRYENISWEIPDMLID